MKTEDRDRLKDLGAALPSGARLRLTLTRHDLSDRFQAYGRTLQEVLPGIDLVTDIRSDTAPPWMETGAGIRFQALPEDDKLDSLVDALRPSDQGAPPIAAAHHEWLERLPLPVEIRLYIAPACPFCPQALKQWIALARAGERLRLRVIDGALFPDSVREENIKAVPTLVLDRHLRWSGRIPVGEVLEQLVVRDPSRLSSDALDGLIKEGLAGQVARTMIAKGHLFPALFDLLTHSKWPVRLGAMVVMEEIAAADRPLAAEAVAVLQKRYPRLDDPIRGDVLYVIGEAGDQQALPFLRDAETTSENPEVRQAAREALARIQEHRDAGQTGGP
jgi:hypothetical protein